MDSLFTDDEMRGHLFFKSTRSIIFKRIAAPGLNQEIVGYAYVRITCTCMSLCSVKLVRRNNLGICMSSQNSLGNNFNTQYCIMIANILIVSSLIAAVAARFGKEETQKNFDIIQKKLNQKCRDKDKSESAADKAGKHARTCRFSKLGSHL